MKGQDLPADSACDQAVDGMLGKEPKPSSAKPYSLQPCVAQGVRGRVYAQSQSHATRRTLRSSAVHSGSVDRSGGFVSQAAISLSSWLGKSLPSTGVLCGNRALTLHCSLAGTRQNRATCCAGRGQSESAFRIGGSYGLVQSNRRRASCGTPLCSAQSSTCGASEMAAFLSRIGCKFELEYSLPFFRGVIL